MRLSLMTVVADLVTLPTVLGDPIAFAVCQAACNTGRAACYAAASYTSGVTLGLSALAARTACEFIYTTCVEKCNASLSLTPSSCAPPEEESTCAREDFASQKAISSDICIARDEEEGGNAAQISGDCGLLGDRSLDGVQAAAREVLQYAMSNPHVQNGVETLRRGALKLSEFLTQIGEH